MTVKELIDKLNHFSYDSVVLCGVDEIDCACEIAQVLSISDGDTDEVLIMQQEVITL